MVKKMSRQKGGVTKCHIGEGGLKQSKKCCIIFEWLLGKGPQGCQALVLQVRQKHRRAQLVPLINIFESLLKLTPCKVCSNIFAEVIPCQILYVQPSYLMYSEAVFQLVCIGMSSARGISDKHLDARSWLGASLLPIRFQPD